MITPEIEKKLNLIFESAIQDKKSKESESVSEAWTIFLEKVSFAPLLKALLEDLRFSDLGADPSYFVLHFMTAKSASDWWKTSVQDAVFGWIVDEQGESQEFADDEIESIQAEIFEVFSTAKFEKIREILVEHLLT